MSRPPQAPSSPRPGVVFLAVFIPALLVGALVLVLTSGADEGSERGAVPEDGSIGVERPQVGADPRPEPDPQEETGLDVMPNAPRPAIPSRIGIPDLGVDATVSEVGSTRRGISVPPVTEAGWFDGGPRPGEPGRSVVIGHIDSKDGPAVFANLPSAEQGSEITIEDRSGASHTYQVARVLEVSKAEFPTSEVYGSSERPMLVLVTCTGDFYPQSGYESNLIVFAEQVAAG